MYQAFLINLAIVTLVLLSTVLTRDPMCLLALLLLQHMPIVPQGYVLEEDDEDDGPKIGFSADL